MDFFEQYKIYKKRINKKLSYTLKSLPFQKSNLLKAMKYSIFSGGKRLRSCLVYATGEMFKINMITLDTISAAIECIHSYSLIHDDLPCMDNDDFRRGKPSCHKKYNENISLLAGDALQSLAFRILSKDLMPGVSNLKRIKMIAELSHAIGASGMCMGQMLDLEEKRKEVDLSQLNIINLYKTAFLMRSSIRLVLLSSNNIPRFILSIFDCFSKNIGLAFQMQDDISDFKDTTYQIQNHKEKNKNFNQDVKSIEEFKKIIKKLYKKAYFSLNLLKNNNFNTETLKKLTRFIIKRIEET